MVVCVATHLPRLCTAHQTSAEPVVLSLPASPKTPRRWGESGACTWSGALADMSGGAFEIALQLLALRNVSFTAAAEGINQAPQPRALDITTVGVTVNSCRRLGGD